MQGNDILNTLANYVVQIIPPLSIALWGATFVVSKLNRYIPREYFALLTLTSFISIFVSFIPILFLPDLYIQKYSFLWVTPSVFKEHLLESIKSILLICFVFSTFLNWAISKHKNWAQNCGFKSINHYQEDKDKIPADLRRDVIVLWQKRHLLKVYQDKIELDDIINLIPLINDKEETWHYQIATLLNLHSNQYQIDLEKDWYKEYHCFISKYGKNNEIFGLYCTQEEPTLAVCNEFLEFMKSQSKSNPIHKLMIVVRNGLFPSKTVHLDNEHTKIEYRFKNELLNSILNEDDGIKYYKTVIQRAYLDIPIDLDDSTVISDIYVEPHLIKHHAINKHTTIIEETEKYINEWISDSKSPKQLAILGEYGQGKSVLALKIAYNLIHHNHIRIPILIELRGSSPRSYRTKLEFLSVWASKYGINPNFLLKLHEIGRLLLIFDGFDEMDMIGSYEIRLQHFKQIWDFAAPNAKFIITGRPNFFLNDHELQALLVTHQKIPTLPYCEALHLKMFDTAQIEHALRYKPAIQTEISRLMKQNTQSSFYDLMQRPSLLFMASKIWDSEKLSQSKNNINSAFIIEQFLEHCYKKQQEKEIQLLAKNEVISSILSVAERSYFMQGIAVAMVQRQHYSNQIDLGTLNQAINSLIDGFDTRISQNQTISNIQREDFAMRKQSAKQQILRDIISCGILVRDFSGEDLFKFAHKSFLEFLVSQFYILQIIDDKKDVQKHIIVDTICNALNFNLLQFTHNEDTSKFIAELLLNKSGLNQNDSSEKNCLKLFEFLYPVRILDKFPSIAFPSFKSIYLGVLVGFATSTFMIILCGLTHWGLFAQFVAIFTVGVSLLFGLRRIFRVAYCMSWITGALINLMCIHPPGIASTSENIATNNDVSIETILVMLFAFFSWVFIYKLFLIKYLSRNKSYSHNIPNAISIVGSTNNKSIDKLMHLWIIACESLGIPESTLLKYMTKRTLKRLKNYNQN